MIRAVALFPGQGSQFRGMGRELFPRYRHLLQQANDILGFSVEKLCLDDPGDDLIKTQFTQVALFVVNALYWQDQFGESGRLPDAVCGHSLGEYNALFAAGVFDFATGLKLVKKRGELMGRQSGGGMAAVIGCDAYCVRKILDDFAFDTLDIANYNSSDQVVISGPKRDIEDVAAVFAEVPNLRYVILSVSGAFHSKYMREAGNEFGAFIRTLSFNPPRFPVISNLLARPYTSTDLITTLTSQISHPVRWLDSINYLIDQGACDFHEVGPGTTLTRLLYRIAPDLVQGVSAQ
ncbi:MAG: ACP S-malonyltransferase [Nostoc sp.]|uniref:ACP S-malonyltransferase n=1 Tax=Nostoc sp. TaxID=1180 RepID=UPI002FF6D545